MGVSRVEHMYSNLKAMEIAQNWTPEKEAKMTEVLGNNPETAFDFNKVAPQPPRRQIVTQ